MLLQNNGSTRASWLVLLAFAWACTPAESETRSQRADSGVPAAAGGNAGASGAPLSPEAQAGSTTASDDDSAGDDDSAADDDLAGDDDAAADDDSAGDDDSAADDDLAGDDDAVTPRPELGGARELAARLGRSHFLIGMGNDLAEDHQQDGAYTLGVNLDIHYAYLVGLPEQGGWPDWNPDGTFVDVLAAPAIERDVVPMFTLYAMAAQGENNLEALEDADFMSAYWEGAQLLFQRLAVIDKPAIVHLEPDFWAYTQQANPDPDAQAARVGSVVASCAGFDDTLAGMGHCLVHLARELSPKVAIGFHASEWADPNPAVTAQYLVKLGADEADFVALETLDRDAGCFEVGDDPNCTRTGAYYWDETNQTSPNFHEHLQWAKAVGDGVGRPLLWWQMPFGVPSDNPGGSIGAYRDNRVKYLFEHVDEFAAAGGVGAVFGVGASNQTTITTDGGQFQRAVQSYYESPYPL